MGINGNGHAGPKLQSLTLRGQRLGSVDGFYPVSGIEEPGTPQLWVPEVLQTYEARCLAKIIASVGVKYDGVFVLARGGLDLGRILAYNLGVKRVHVIQTDGYNDKNESLEVPRVIGVPDPKYIAKESKDGGPPKFLLGDELIDKGGAMRIASDIVAELTDGADCDRAVIYDKVQPRPDDVQMDYVARRVTNLWLDHESQSDPERRNFRLEELRALAPEIAANMGWLSIQPVNVDLVPALVEHSSIDSHVEVYA